MVTSRDWIIESALTELVGANETVAQNEYGAGTAIPVSISAAGGIIKSLILSQVELDAGAILSVAGVLVFFTADPICAVGDTALTSTAWGRAVGTVTVAAGDWVTDANGGVALKSGLDIPFPRLANLWCVFKLTSATSINSGATDDEVLSIKVYYENMRNQ
jgi:hypothetical protein